MKVYPELKAIANYIGQQIKCVSGGRFEANYLSKDDGGNTILSPSLLADFYEGNFDYKNFRLVLKPLLKITDDDAIQVAKLEFGPIRHQPIDDNKIQWITIVKEHVLRKILRPDVYQLLISLGYDFHNYLLDGKTLEESNLAIYEN